MTTTDPSSLSITQHGGVVRLTLNRPAKRNCLSHAALRELEAALAAIAGDSSVRIVVLAAEGPVFCAGHDLSEMTGRLECEYAELFSTCSRMMLSLRRLPQPVVARVQGPALAAGCQLVAACDLAVASERATFSTPGVKIGLFCTTPMVPLVRAIPAKPAMEMLLTGEPISAHRALELGLINRVVQLEQLDDAINALIRPILAASPLVVRLGKAAFHRGLSLDEPSAYEDANAVMTENALKDDAQEGIGAFLEKRKAASKGV
jgi:enoyl-CoA hydratase/carnithine racemase